MRRREFLSESVISGLTLAGMTPNKSTGEALTKPNVILILSDDQGWWETGAYGNPIIQTPNTDRLAAQGVRLNYFYVSPLCTPTRSSLLTGRHYHRTGAFDTDMGYDALRPEEITIAEVLQAQGYRTGLVGKWHLGRYMKYHPNAQGFQDFFGFWQDGMIQRWTDPNHELYFNKLPFGATGYITDILTDQAISFVKRNQENPFFLYLAYNAAHMPAHVPDAYAAKYIQKGLSLVDSRIYGCLECLDENVGRLLKVVDELKLAENTLVIYTSDNGGVSKHFKAGLRGAKATVYEGGIRVPFIARWPGRFPAGTVANAMAQHIDILPTVCEAVNTLLPTNRKIDGKSILPILKKGGGDSPHFYTFHQQTRIAPKMELPTAQEVIACRVVDQPWPNWAVRDQQGYKLVATTIHGDPPSLRYELFNLRTDPGETHNLASQEPVLVQKLKEEFAGWFADVTAGQDYKQVPIQVGRADENPVVIDLNWRAAVEDRLKPSIQKYDRDTIDNWTNVGDTLRWLIEVVEGGLYEVVLAYGCRPSDAGSKLRIQAGDSHFEHVTLATPERKVYRRFRVGELRLTAGQEFLEMKAVSIRGLELFALHRIELSRMTA